MLYGSNLPWLCMVKILYKLDLIWGSNHWKNHPKQAQNDCFWRFESVKRNVQMVYWWKLLGFSNFMRPFIWPKFITEYSL